MKTMTALALAGSILLGGASAHSQTPPPPPPAAARSQADAYVVAAAKSDLYEITSSRIAAKKSPTPAVREFAAMLVRHHQQTTAATKAAAAKSGLSPKPPALDAGAAASVKELQSVSARDFDRLYLGQQVPAHQAALDLHRSYGEQGDKPALRASAKTAVPIVQRHLDAAKTLLSVAR
jgi:putative membrane protein